MTRPQANDSQKVDRFRKSLAQFIDRVRKDRYVLAVVLVGGLNEQTIWQKDAIGIWVIEADGVTRRLRSDGDDEHIYRTFVEDNVNIHAQVIPRSRFKLMIEGSSRTAFSCNFFATREIIYSCDPSIDGWFEQANSVAVKDQERELLTFSTWTFYATRQARRFLNDRNEIELGMQEILIAAHSIAYTEIIKSGQVHEGIVIHKAMSLNPKLFEVIYAKVMQDGNNLATLEAALTAIDAYLQEHYSDHLKPLLAYLTKADRVVPLSEIGDQFAYSQVYPWHIEAACEWLERNGKLQKLSVAFKLTKRSQHDVEEPAYYLS
jgi:uncharacterized protein